jgi:hypothetical protein
MGVAFLPDNKRAPCDALRRQRAAAHAGAKIHSNLNDLQRGGTAARCSMFDVVET